MALSDQLTKLSARAKELEDRAAAAKSKGKADLEQDVKEARESAQGQADELRKSAEAGKGKISVWWDDVQRSWNENIAKIRKNVDDRRAAARREGGATRGRQCRRRRRVRDRLRIRRPRRSRVRRPRRRPCPQGGRRARGKVGLTKAHVDRVLHESFITPPTRG